MSNPTRAVGYLRVSTRDQADGGVSIDAQRDRIASYVDALQIEIVDVIADEGVSAKTLERPGLRRILAMFDSHEVNALVVAKLDRLSRSVRDLATLVETYFAGGEYALLSVADSIDTRSANGRLVLHILGSVAEWEREVVAERTADALAHLKRSGVHVGRAGFGWRHGVTRDQDARRVIEAVDGEQRAIETIVDLRERGSTYREISDALVAAGIATQRGGRWHPQTVARICARAGVR